MFYRSAKFQLGLAIVLAACLGGVVLAQTKGGASLEDIIRAAQTKANAQQGAAQAIVDGQSTRYEAYQARAAALTAGNAERLKKGLGLYGSDVPSDVSGEDVPTIDGAVYVAVSLSMPKDTLRKIVEDAHKANAAVVIQGPVGGSFKTTFKLMLADFGGIDQGGVQIDPRVFRQYHITQVPAVVVARDAVPDCSSGIDCQRSDVPFDIVRGNISLDAALKLLAEKGQAAPDIAAAALARLED